MLDDTVPQMTDGSCPRNRPNSEPTHDRVGRDRPDPARHTLARPTCLATAPCDAAGDDEEPVTQHPYHSPIRPHPGEQIGVPVELRRCDPLGIAIADGDRRRQSPYRSTCRYVQL